VNKKAKIYLCSFASDDLKKSIIRFKKQAEEMKVYNDIKVYGFDDLSKSKKIQIEEFKKKKQNRLFGYACWKPEIILRHLNFIPNGAILQYSDIGCHFNPKGVDRFYDYLRYLNEYNILGFKYIVPKKLNWNHLFYQEYFEFQYTKGDVLKYFDIDMNSEIAKSQQFWSGVIFFKNNEFTKNFVNKWSEACKKNNLIDDSKSSSVNHKNFIEHRHDQSIFSIIAKLNNVFYLSASECEWAEDKNGKTWEHLKENPILAKRDKKYNIFKRFFSRQKKNYNRILKKLERWPSG
tara:strand:- start:19 stop:891 length:873 start_codon:yes stop_codon:yes gene_type:complete